MQVHRVLKQDGIFIFSVMNRNLVTWSSIWWHTEWQRDLPKQIFDWRMGVTPVEMKDIHDEVGFNMVHEELEGICDSRSLSVNWGRAPWILQFEHLGAVECKDVSKRYLGWAYKHPAAEHSLDSGTAAGGKTGEL